jgi:hypothetical protein
MLHQLDAWHAEQVAWRIEIVKKIEATLDGCSDHWLGHDTLTH